MSEIDVARVERIREITQDMNACIQSIVRHPAARHAPQEVKRDAANRQRHRALTRIQAVLDESWTP